MMHIGKQILFLEPKDGRLSPIGPSLEALGFKVLSSSSVSAALKLVGETKLLSLVAIDDGIGVEHGAELLASVKELHPDLPVLWVRSEAATAPLSASEYTPDIVLSHPVDVKMLSAEAERLLREHLYPQLLVNVFARSCISVMQDAYHTNLEVDAMSIRANRNALGAVTAILPFVGRYISGRLVVSGEEAHFLAIRSGLFETAQACTRLEAEDLAGEYANLVIGRLKAYFVRNKLDFELGTPIQISGTDVVVRYRASRPTLVLSLRGDAGMLFVGFCFDLFDRKRASKAPHDEAGEVESLDAGDLRFL